MPRHPPCALHSLSQQRHNNTPSTPPDKHTKKHTTPTHNQGQRQHTSQPPQDKEGSAGTTHIRSTTTHHNTSKTNPTRINPHTSRCAAVKDARVHYADLKQQPHQPPHTHQHKTGTRALRRRRAIQKPQPTHTPQGGTCTADPSGPNSVFNQPPANARQLTRKPPPTPRCTSTTARVEHEQSTFH